MSEEELQEALLKIQALLRIDPDGEAIAEALSKILVDRQQRDLLRLKLKEISDSPKALEQKDQLTNPEREVTKIVVDAGKPLTAQEVSERASESGSLRYRQYASATLNALVSKGALGRVTVQGRQQYFDVAIESVKYALGRLPEETSDGDKPHLLSESTGLSLARILQLLREI